MSSSSLYVLDALEGFESRHTRHHLVEEDEIECLLLTLLNGVESVAHRHYIVAFLLKEDDMGAEMLNLIVNPK